MQGHRVTIPAAPESTPRGIVDYHYLGDPNRGEPAGSPRHSTRLMALYAGKQWVNEPGKKWDWSISGFFQLLVTIVERASGESFADYVRQNIFAPAGVKTTAVFATIFRWCTGCRTRIVTSKRASCRRTRTLWLIMPTCGSAAPWVIFYSIVEGDR